jgi:hypothetical protein
MMGRTSRRSGADSSVDPVHRHILISDNDVAVAGGKVWVRLFCISRGDKCHFWQLSGPEFPAPTITVDAPPSRRARRPSML